MRKNYFLGTLSFFIITISIFAFNKTEKPSNRQNSIILNASEKLLPPSASISGTTQVCKDETPQPQITFTGSAGTQPYTFTYILNGGTNQTITTKRKPSNLQF